ncbi:DUF2264 domain-containing protein [Tuberibacillus sp. Marseille-P3662]|uniref:DUF2264 domain-containing protein n=1 Tax=Tuberibacillus sp. Marseille-P3662 TaxID=1965358 RepID=UPI000A1CED05|nr:DUF2264 domain-containing protein [Tuberibacillus sp. Marseille-P3662]
MSPFNTSFNLRHNPLRTKKDLQDALKDICAPLESFFSEGHAKLNLGETAAHYDKEVAGMEAFSRPLWGIIPVIAGGGSTLLVDKFIEGIKNGTNPSHNEFWGDINDYDQRIVESAVFGLSLALGNSLVWEHLSSFERKNLYNWLNAVNQKKPADNNWHLFRVMVNVGFYQLGLDYDKETTNHSLERIEDFYLGDGWYSDGLTTQKDYYISFAVHFYCLVYASYMEKEDPVRSERYKSRAAVFAKDFIYWFSKDGSAFPFGRSMTYRFAQAAFWSALAFSGVEVFSWGVIKGLILRHLRWWFQQPIFSHEDLLTIGYCYPNLIMSENYNAPGSPYWALKTFWVLALERDHPFWKAVEEPLPQLEEIKVLRHPQMIVCRDYLNKHVYSLTSGQYDHSEHSHSPEKYSKFAYSNMFGFSIPKENRGLKNGAYDSMLALSEKDDDYVRVRSTCETVEVNETNIYSLWKPWNNVMVETWLIPLGLWHVRLHHIQNERALDAAEGGFAIPKEKPYTSEQSKIGIVANSSAGNSGMIDMLENRRVEAVTSAPNTNLMYASVSSIPTLIKTLEVGSHWMATAVLAHTEDAIFQEYWRYPPRLKRDELGLQIIYDNDIRFTKKV